MKDKCPEISVIMSVYNQKDKEVLKQSICSVLGQTFTDFEFIIYNDGSDADVVEELKQYEKQDARIVFVDNPVNKGLAASLNNCIDMARGKYLARMDDDDICMPERFAVQHQFLLEHPEFVLVGCAAELLDGEGVWGVRRLPEHPEWKDFLKYSPFVHPSVMIRRSVFEEAGRYQEEKDIWRCEDYELFMRLYRLGMKGYNLPQALLQYREDRNSYRKRTWKYRIDEMKLRYRNFKEMKLLFPFGWIQVLRPIIAGLVPGDGVLKLKHFYYRIRHLKENMH